MARAGLRRNDDRLELQLAGWPAIDARAAEHACRLPQAHADRRDAGARVGEDRGLRADGPGGLDVPTHAVGAVIPALARLGATFETPAPDGETSTITAVLPATRADELQRELPALTRGRACSIPASPATSRSATLRPGAARGRTRSTWASTRGSNAASGYEQAPAASSERAEHKVDNTGALQAFWCPCCLRALLGSATNAAVPTNAKPKVLRLRRAAALSGRAEILDPWCSGWSSSLARGAVCQTRWQAASPEEKGAGEGPVATRKRSLSKASSGIDS